MDEVFAKSPKLEVYLENPRIDSSEKTALLDRVFQGKVSSTLLKFLKVCAVRRRLGSLRSIAREARALQDAAVGRLAVQVTTAQPLQPSELEQLMRS